MAMEEEPPFNAGDIQTGIEGLARAVTWLTGTLKEERIARRALESQITDKLNEAVAKLSTPDTEPVNAPPLTPMATTHQANGQVVVGDRGDKSAARGSVSSAVLNNSEKIQGNAALIQALSADMDSLRNGLSELQAFVRYLDENFGSWKKQQEQRQIVADALLAKELESMRANIAEELSALEDSVADKVAEEIKAAVEKDAPRKLESRRTLAVLPDTADLGGRLDATCKALTERLDLLDERVNGLARPVLTTAPRNIPQEAILEFDEADEGAPAGGDNHDSSRGLQQGLQRELPEAPSAESSPPEDPSAPLRSDVRSVAEDPAVVAQAPQPTPVIVAQAQGVSEEVLQTMLEQVKADTAQTLQYMQNRLDAMEAECRKLGEQLEASLLEEAAAPVEAPGEEQQQQTEQSVTSSTSKTVVRPAMKRLCRAKTEGGLNLPNIRRQSTNSSDRHRSSSSDRAIPMTPSNPRELRTELMRHMELQMQEFRDQTKEGTEDAVATATGKLRSELMGWLSTEMKNHPTAAPGSTTESDGAGASASAVSAVAAQSAPAKASTIPAATAQAAASKDAVSAAAVELRREIGAWLEEQLAAIREMASRPVSAPSSPERQPAAEKAEEERKREEARIAEKSEEEIRSAAEELQRRADEAVTAAAGQRRDASAQAEFRRQESKERNLAELGEKSVAQAAKQIKAEIGEWLEEQLQALRAASATGPSAPNSRGSLFGRGLELSSPPEGQRHDFEQESDTSSVMHGLVSQYSGGLDNLQDVVRWFESQMNELGSSLTKSRKDAVARASSTIREEVQGWWKKEMNDFHRSVSKSRASILATKKDAEDTAPDVSERLMTLRESPVEWLGGRFNELVEALATDEDLLTKILDRVHNELVAEETEGNEGKPATKADERSDPGSRRGSPRAPRRNMSRDSLKRDSSALQELSDRVQELENSMPSRKMTVLGPVPDLAEASKAATSVGSVGIEGPADFMSMLEVHDALRRLTTRFEYLERLVPPDVQKALQFFEPLNTPTDGGAVNDRDPASPSGAAQMVSSAAIIRRINELQAGQANVSEEAKGMSEDARREVVNLSRALRGTQRDSEVNASKLDDLQRALAALKTRLEATLPQVLQVVEGLHRPLQGTPGETATAVPEEGAAADGGPRPSPVEGLRALLRTGSEELPEVDAPHPFVSQNGLRRAIDTLQGDVQAWLNKLREDLSSALKGKADNDMFRRAIEDLHHQVQTPVHILGPPEAVSTDGSAAFRLPFAQGRCLTCDTKVELRIDDPRSWNTRVKTVPSPAFPQRFPNVPPSLAPPPNMRPAMPPSEMVGGNSLGRSLGGSSPMKRVESLPAISRS